MEQGGTPNFELPREQPENAPEQDEARQEQSVERAPARPEKSAQATKQPALPVIPDDIPAADVPDVGATDDTAHPTDTHQPIKDSDHIEPEWVDKAKAVIAQTKNDPYQQKNEMSKVKADYIRKRFGKDIKTDEAAA
ncbi:MAG TPA: hypothetical protein VFH37_01850 [Candidatus Saccharimonadales bacterium]|nr:hypothetical protein [Candidatus Saccharimonadales bacterium]